MALKRICLKAAYDRCSSSLKTRIVNNLNLNKEFRSIGFPMMLFCHALRLKVFLFRPVLTRARSGQTVSMLGGWRQAL